MITELEVAYGVQWWGLDAHDQARYLGWAHARRGTGAMGLTTTPCTIVELQRLLLGESKKNKAVSDDNGVNSYLEGM